MPRKKPAGHYTFMVSCSFQMQYTFTAKEVQHDPGGTREDYEPTDAAHEALARELTAHLGQDYAVADLQVEADSDSLIGFLPST